MKFNVEQLLLSPKYKKPRMYVLVGVGGLILFFVAKGIVKKVRLNLTERRSVDDDNVHHANVLRMAMNPSGNRWMRSFDGTNKVEIFNTARKIDDMNKVAKAYKNLYDSSIYQDLQKELKIEDYNKFITMLDQPRSTEILLTEGMSADDIHILALDLYDDLDGFSVVRKYSLYKDILALTDNNFIALNNHYNELYLDKTGKSLYQQVKKEILFGVDLFGQWGIMKGQMLDRFKYLMLD